MAMRLLTSVSASLFEQGVITLISAYSEAILADTPDR